MPKKKTIEEVREYIESESYKFLSTEYINNNTKLELECLKGHEFKMSYNSFQQKHRCPICMYKKSGLQRKRPFKDVKKYIESEDYKLLSGEDKYTNSYSKLKLRCPKEHEFKMRQDQFRSGHRCPICARIRVAEKTRKLMLERRKTIEEIREIAKSVEYEVLSQTYTPWEKTKYKCPNGHEFEMLYSNFYSGTRCPKCYRERTRNRMLNGQAIYMLSCIKNPSRPQIELFHLVQEIYPDAVLNYAYLNYSIDIAIIQLKLAVEYDGSPFHPGENESSFACPIKGEKYKKDQERQRKIEEEGWTFLIYRDYIPSTEELKTDIKEQLLIKYIREINR